MIGSREKEELPRGIRVLDRITRLETIKVSGYKHLINYYLFISLGYYTYFEAGDWNAWRNRQEGQKAILESPNIKPQLGPCNLELYYHMWGSDMGKLQVYQKNSEGFRLLKEVSGDQGNQWNKMAFSLSSYSDYRIHIIALQGTGEKGDIGLDDLKFTGCKFDSSVATSYCDPSKKKIK